MATAKTITAFKYRTEVIADITKHTSEFKKAEATIQKYGKTTVDEAKKSESAWSSFFKGVSKGQEQFSGAKFGKKFGEEFGSNAVSAISNTFSVSTLGGLIGTAIAPGIGTTIGSAIGGGIDTAISKVAPIILSTIDRGIALNKLLEDTRVEFKATVGSEQEANKYLNELLGVSKDLGILPATVIATSEKLSDLTGNLKLTRTLLKAAADQAADFGGSVETFQKVAEVLGLIAEKGEMTNREIRTMYKLGIDAKKYLLEATGLQEKQLEKLMAAGRIRGDVAARLIAEGIEREKGGLAAYKTSQTVSGRERQFGVLTDLRSAEGTQQATRAIGDFYEKANAILDSPQAKAFTDFINNWSGKLIDFTEGALKTGVSIGGGVAEGLLNFNPATMMQSLTKFRGMLGTMFGDVLEMHSPSKWSAREIGIPLGEGIFDDNAGSGMLPYIQTEGRDRLVATLEALLADPKIQALLKTIETAEGGAPNRIVGGRTISDLSRHPNIVGMRTSKGPSTAAGSYQITGTNWRKIAPQLGLSDFGPHNQALAALSIIAGHPGGLQALMSGDITKLEKFVALDWTSTPGSRIGGGGQKSQQQWMGYYNQALNANGAAITDINPMPVRFVADSMGGASALFRQATPDSLGGAAATFGNQQQAQNLKEYTLNLSDADGAVVDLKVDAGNLAEVLPQVSQQLINLLTAVELPLRAITPLIGAEKSHAATAINLTKKYQEAARKEVIIGMSTLDQLSGMLGQVAGMMPQQTVGKKRGLFSKILGIAAPFLSFIPGVGPILSTVAGMASNAVGGNWAGVATGLAGGLAPGGPFRGSGGGSTGTTWGNIQIAPPHRAMGGPVRRGRQYVVGEHRPELFVPNSDGRILPSVNGGIGDASVTAQLIALIERQNSFFGRLEGMRPHDVVRLGARGYIEAQVRDAGLVKLQSQLQRQA